MISQECIDLCAFSRYRGEPSSASPSQSQVQAAVARSDRDRDRISPIKGTHKDATVAIRYQHPLDCEGVRLAELVDS